MKFLEELYSTRIPVNEVRKIGNRQLAIVKYFEDLQQISRKLLMKCALQN